MITAAVEASESPRLEKYCRQCDTTKPTTEFGKCAKITDGLQSYCKTCSNKNEKQWRLKNKDKIKATSKAWRARNLEKARAYSRAYAATHRDQKKRTRDIRLARDPKWEWAKQAARNARNRAQTKNLPYGIDAAFLLSIAPDICPVLGVSIAYPTRGSSKAGANGRSATVDRIRPELGYVQSNVAVISHRANAIKQDASAEEIEAVLMWLKKVR